MASKIDFAAVTSDHIEATLCERIARIRLSRNMTEAQLAAEAGVSQRTIGRLENGDGVSLDTFIRVLMALRIQQSLATLLSDPAVRLVDRVAARGYERQRARPPERTGRVRGWTWADE